MWLYHDPLLNDRPGAFADYFPTTGKVQSNPLLVVNLSPERPFCALCCNITPSKDVAGGFGSPSYCFPSSTFDADGKHMQDNVTLQALIRFQNFYADDAITRDDIFHYVYGLLHHPAYRARYAESLKRELPRIPLVAADGSLHAPPEPDKKSDPKASKKDAAVFHAFAEAGRYLANLHINYEQQPEFPLERLENKHVPLNWRVEAIKLTKDRSTILYNDFLTLRGIPPTIFDYKLGNRSALEWIIDQYRITRDDQGKIVSDPNRLDDEQYIVRLVGQVITVSLETLKTVESLPPLSFK